MAEQVLPPSPPITGVNGVYVPGAMVYYYRSGTDTLLNVYSDQSEGTQIANPVVADSNGRIVQTFLDPSETVRIVVHDDTDTLLYELDEAPFALTQTVNASDITHTPTALNTATDVAAAIASSDARAQTKAPKNSPVFTGTISGVSLGLSGAMTAVSGAFSGALSAASAAITGAITAASATISGTTTSERLRLTATNDASLADNDAALQIGADDATNVVHDNNEVQARNNGAASTYRINNEGGDVFLSEAGSEVHARGILSTDSGLVTDATSTPGGYTYTAWLLYTGTDKTSPGETVSGSSLSYYSEDTSGGTYSALLTGTDATASWRCNGVARNGHLNLFTRITRA